MVAETERESGDVIQTHYPQSNIECRMIGKQSRDEEIRKNGSAFVLYTIQRRWTKTMKERMGRCVVTVWVVLDLEPRLESQTRESTSRRCQQRFSGSRCSGSWICSHSSGHG